MPLVHGRFDAGGRGPRRSLYGVPDPWLHPSPAADHRVCAKCGHQIPPGANKEPAQTATNSGWRCGDCTRAYYRDIDRVARMVIEQPSEMLVHRPRHRPYEECRRCDIAARVDELTLWADAPTV